MQHTLLNVCSNLLYTLFVFTLGLFIGWAHYSGTITTKEPITPELQIKVIDGVADTTYIYNQPKG